MDLFKSSSYRLEIFKAKSNSNSSMYRIYKLNVQNGIYIYIYKRKLSVNRSIHKTTQINAMATTETTSPSFGKQ